MWPKFVVLVGSMGKVNKFRTLRVLASLALLLFSSVCSVQRCPDMFKSVKFVDGETKDQSVVKFLEGVIGAGEEFDPDCPLEMVKVGLYQSAEMLIKDHFVAKGENIENNFKFGAKSITTKLNNLQKLSMLSGKSVEIQPAFKWGQSHERVLMFIKFANRIDSPGCLDRSDLLVNVDENHNFTLSARCILAGALANFKLEFPLFSEVWPKSIKVENAGVGSILVTIKKQKSWIWPQIWHAGHPKISSATVWWDLKGKEYDLAMKTFGNMHQRMDARDDEGLWSNEKKQSVSLLQRAWEWIRSTFKRLFN